MVRLALMSDETLDGEVFEGIAAKLDEPELLELKKVYEARSRKLFPSQLRAGTERKETDGDMFRV